MSMVMPHTRGAYTAKRQVIHGNLKQDLVDAHRAGMGVVGDILLQGAIIRKQIQPQRTWPLPCEVQGNVQTGVIPFIRKRGIHFAECAQI